MFKICYSPDAFNVETTGKLLCIKSFPAMYQEIYRTNIQDGFLAA